MIANGTWVPTLSNSRDSRANSMQPRYFLLHLDTFSKRSERTSQGRMNELKHPISWKWLFTNWREMYKWKMSALFKKTLSFCAENEYKGLYLRGGMGYSNF